MIMLLNNTFGGDLNTTAVSGILIVPETINIWLLLIGIYGMYQGIQIIHPIYAVLFLNLLVQFVSSGISLVAFPVLESDKFVRLSNGNNSLSLLFHCTAWCVTSILR